MSQRSALVTGATGLLGRQVKKAFDFGEWATTGTGFSRAEAQIRKVDLGNDADVSKTIEQVKYAIFPGNPSQKNSKLTFAGHRSLYTVSTLFNSTLPHDSKSETLTRNE